MENRSIGTTKEPERKVLVVVDAQGSFVKADGDLSLFPGEVYQSSKFINDTSKFLKSIPKGYYDSIVVTQDTHFSENYEQLEESKSYPPHCIYGTDGHKTVFDPKILEEKTNVVGIVNKNRYDAWKNEQDDPGTLKGEELEAHNNLNRVRVNGKLEGNLETFYQEHIGKDAVIHVMGVASDVCNEAAVRGFLERGNKVVIIEDLTKGITKETPEVLKNPFYEKYIKSGHIRVTTAEYAFNPPEVSKGREGPETAKYTNRFKRDSSSSVEEPGNSGRNGIGS